MATGYTQEKIATETIRIGADFTSALVNGDSIILGNVTVTCVNTITGVNAPSILSGTPQLASNVLTQKVTGGVNGDVYTITIFTGLTTLGLSSSSEIILSITDSPSSALVLASREEVKRQLQIIDTSDDNLIDDILVAVSSYIRKRTGRDFVIREYNETVRPENGNTFRLQLSQWPVVAVKRIRTYEGSQTIPSTDITDATAFDFLPEGYVWFDPFGAGGSFLPWPGRNVITYIAGFVKVPEDVRQAVTNMAIATYRGLGKEGLLEEKIGDYYYRARKGSELPPSIRREINDAFIEGVINRYRSTNLGWVDSVDAGDD